MKRLLALLLGAFSIGACYSQETILEGVVTDSLTKEPIIGVNVTYAPGKGGATDPNGNYSFAIPAGEHQITFSFVGYSTRKIELSITPGETRSINMQLR